MRFLRIAVAVTFVALVGGAALLAVDLRNDSTVSSHGIVEDVIDGDTLDIDIDGTITRVRLLGIDAPELSRDGHPAEMCATEATDYLRTVVEGESVTVTPDPSQPATDHYGRVLAYVDTPALDTSAALLRAGLADLYHSAPDIERYDEYERIRSVRNPATCAFE